MPTPRVALGTAVIDGIIYAVGGGNYSCGTYATVEAYDPATNTWTTKASMPTPRYALAVVAVNGMLYAIGGGGYCNDVFNRATVEAFDPATNTWTTKASMPGAHRYVSASVIDGIIYVVGSFQGVYAYDPAANAWTTKTAVTLLREVGATAEVNGLMYRVGGYNNSGWVLPVDVYDPVADSLTRRVSPIATGRYRPGAAAIGSTVYVVGGEGTTAVEAYNPASDTWTTQASMPTMRSPAVAVVNGVLYAIGGGNGSPTGTNEAFTPDDTTPPVIASITASPNTIWPPNGKLVPIVVSVSATDDSALPVTVAITAVSCNELLAVGDVVLTGGLTLKVRADRSGAGSGRIYSVFVRVTDAAGNHSDANVAITVPHDRR